MKISAQTLATATRPAASRPATAQPGSNEPQDSVSSAHQTPRWLDNLKAGSIAYGIPLGLTAGGAAVAGLGTAKLISMCTDNAIAPWVGGVPAAVVGGAVGLACSWAAMWGAMGD